MNKDEKRRVIDVMNGLEVIESNGGTESYILVENNKENHEELNDVGITSEIINKYGDEETFCVLALAFGEGYADIYDGTKLVVFDEEVELKVEEGTKLIFYKHDNHLHFAVSENTGEVSINELTDEKIEELRKFLSVS